MAGRTGGYLTGLIKGIVNVLSGGAAVVDEPARQVVGQRSQMLSQAHAFESCRPKFSPIVKWSQRWRSGVSCKPR